VPKNIEETGLISRIHQMIRQQDQWQHAITADSRSLSKEQKARIELGATLIMFLPRLSRQLRQAKTIEPAQETLLQESLDALRQDNDELFLLNENHAPLLNDSEVAEGDFLFQLKTLSEKLNTYLDYDLAGKNIQQRDDWDDSRSDITVDDLDEEEMEEIPHPDEALQSAMIARVHDRHQEALQAETPTPPVTPKK
jgi:hypothetical protein